MSDMSLALFVMGLVLLRKFAHQIRLDRLGAFVCVCVCTACTCACIRTHTIHMRTNV